MDRSCVMIRGSVAAAVTNCFREGKGCPHLAIIIVIIIIIIIQGIMPYIIYGCTNKCASMHIIYTRVRDPSTCFFFSENIEEKHFSTWETIWHALLNIGNVHDRVPISQVVLTKPPIYSVEFHRPHMGIPSVQLILLLYKIEVLI